MASTILQSSLPITISESDSTWSNFGQKAFEGKYNYPKDKKTQHLSYRSKKAWKI